MDKQFCNYENSLRLKELGFNKECFAAYDSSNNLRIYFCGITANWNMNNLNPEVIKVSAPLFQQAFEFLLNKLENYNSDYFLMSIQLYSDGSGKWINRFEEGFCFNDLNEAVKIGIELLEETKK